MMRATGHCNYINLVGIFRKKVNFGRIGIFYRIMRTVSETSGFGKSKTVNITTGINKYCMVDIGT